MKLTLTTLLATLLATSSFAGNSDRYNDLRLDTGVGHVSDSRTLSADAVTETPLRVSLSTRNAQGTDASKTYPYINPYGVGPYNDSR